MPDRPFDDAALDRLLGSVVLEWPETPDVGAAVAARLAAPSGLRRPAVRWRPALLVAVVALLLAAGAVAAGALGVGPLRILFADALPTPNVPATPLGTRLALGERLAPAEAEAYDAVPLAVPAALGDPDEVYASEIGIVSMLWAPRDSLPAMPGSGAGMLLMIIPGDLDADLVSKIVVESRASVAPVQVGEAEAFWISGAPHVFRYLLPDGQDGRVTSRIVGDALVWQSGDVVLRMESAAGRDATIGLAESMTSWP
jgi:hypothetical protein